MPAADVESERQSRGGVVRRPDVADRPPADEFPERPEGLLERRRFVVPVGLVEVDRVHLQPVERPLDGLQDVRAGQALLARHHFEADLGGEDDAVAVAGRLQPPPDDRLRLAAGVTGCPRRVDVGGVDQVAAAGDERVEDAERPRLVDGPAEHVPAGVPTVRGRDSRQTEYRIDSHRALKDARFVEAGPSPSGRRAVPAMGEHARRPDGDEGCPFRRNGRGANPAAPIRET